MNMAVNMISVAEVAALLKMNPKTVYEAIKDGEIPGAVHVRGRYRLNEATVLAWLENGGPVPKGKKRR